jgi:hypothetical protein
MPTQKNAQPANLQVQLHALRIGTVLKRYHCVRCQ